MSEKNNSYLMVVSTVIILIIVCIFVLVVSGSHLTRGTYSTNICKTFDECNLIIENNSGYECVADGNDCYTPRKKNASSNGNEYAYKVIFYTYSGCQVLGSCKVFTNGRVDTNTCSGNICCDSWSNTPYSNSGGLSAAAIYSQTLKSNQYFYCVGGSSSPCYASGFVDDCPNPSTEAPKPSTEAPKPSTEAPKDQCYSCKLGEGKEYVYSSSKEAAASKSGGTECVVVSNTNCDNPSKNCYACDTKNGKEYIKNTSKENAEQSGRTNCTIVKMAQCDKEPDNPKTGAAGIIIAWVVGVAAIVYSLWYFKKSSSMK